jgi:predicted nucleic acid-binding protein
MRGIAAMVFIDSSIWIDFLHNGDTYLGKRVDELLRSGEVLISGLVLGEVLCGARSEAEFLALAETFAGLRCLVDDAEVFSEAADLAWKLRAKGIRVPLPDLTIAVHCLRSGASLLSRDRHFALIEEGLGKSFRVSLPGSSTPAP